MAKAKADGTFDEGVSDLDADSIVLKGEPWVLRTDSLTGASTVAYELTCVTVVDRAERPRDAPSGPEDEPRASKRQRTAPSQSGSGTVSQGGGVDEAVADIEEGDPMDEAGVEEATGHGGGRAPGAIRRETDVVLISPPIFPVWKTINQVVVDHGAHLAPHERALRVVRVTTDDGRRLAGVRFPPTLVSVLRTELQQVAESVPAAVGEPEEVADEDRTVISRLTTSGGASASSPTTSTTAAASAEEETCAAIPATTT